jgi:fibronectin-binding autotransporter adhesin
MKPRLHTRATLVAIIMSGSIPSADAANRYWDISAGNGLNAGNGTWGTSSFWATTASPGTTAPGAWTAGSDAFFQTGGANTVAVAAGGVSANSVTQTTNSTATTISSGGGSLTITGAAGIVNSGNSTLTINSALILSGTNTYTINSGSTITIGGGISESGTASINKTGSSLLNLNAANSYSGGTTVAAGRLIVGASGTLGTNVNTNNITVSAGGQLGLLSASNVGSNQTISINSSSSALGGFGVGYTGALPTINTSGTSTFGGVFGINYTGTAGVTSLATLSSTLNTGGASGQWFLGAQGTGTFNGTTLAPSSDGIYRLGGGGGTLTFNQTNVLTGANEVQIGSTSTGGGGVVILGAAQNFTGATTVNGGTLRLGNAGALGDVTTHTTGVTVNGAAIFDLGGTSPTYNAPLVLNSTANGFDTGAFLNSGAAATFGGMVTLQKQTRFGGSGAMLLTGTITGNGVNFIKDSTGLLELQNSGTVTLGAFQGNRGTLQVNSGTTLNFTSMSVGTGNSVGAGLTLNGGAVTSSGTATFGAGSGTASGSLTLNSGTLTVPALNKGSLTFNVNFNGGTLKANAASASFFSAATTALVKAGGAFIDDGGNAITIGRGLDHDPALGLTADGGLTKSGGGTLTLSGTSTYTGATTVSAGTLLVTGALGATDVSVTAASIGGTGTIGGQLSLNSGSSFHVMDLLDPLAVAGTVALYTGFGIDDLAGLNWGSVANGTYTLIDGSLGSGVFAALANNSLASAYNLGGGRSAYFQEGSLQLVVIPEPNAAALIGSFGLIFLLRRRRK